MLGYTKDTWGIEKGSDVDFSMLTGNKKAAANIMGFDSF
jgi:hypothetical protein